MPGVIAVNCASLVGKNAAGIPGMLVASFGASFSAFVLMLAATIATQYIPQTGPAIGAMRGVRAASAALILSAAFTLGAHNIKSTFAVILMLAAFVTVFFFDVSTPLVVLAAGIAGYIFRRVRDKQSEDRGSNG
jgi:chromate transporter